jgi:LPXTG-motif cell wall-anchored protein
MVPRQKFSITLCAMFCMLLLFATTVAMQAQETTTEMVKGNATVSTAQLKGEVVQVEGNNLLVQLSTEEFKMFRVPETRKFFIDGKELSVHDLQPGTTLTATVKTTTTPVTVRTKSVLNGKVWYIAAPTVILTLQNGQNKQYFVKDTDNIRFMVEGRPATVFDLRKGMIVSAEKIVEEPDVEITTDTTVVGHAPAAALPAAAPGAAMAPGTSAPSAPQSAAPEAATPEAPQPAAPETGGTQTNPLLWLSLIAILIIVVVIVVRKSRGKQQ